MPQIAGMEHYGAAAIQLTYSRRRCLQKPGVKFHIVHRDTGWFSRRGKFSFSYALMANARVFLLAMDMLTGFRFG